MRHMKAISIAIGLVMLFMLSGCESNKEKKEKNTPDSSSLQSVHTDKEQIIQDEKYFEIKEDVLVKYKGGFLKEGRIVLPSRVKRIGKKAFSLNKKEKEIPSGQLCQIKIRIPKDVKLDTYAFASMGPMEVIFEEGRKEIEEEAFFASVITGIESKVVLPSTIKILRKRCFCNILGGSFLTVELNDEIEEIEDSALRGVYAQTIPRSVKKIGKNAFGEWGRLPQELPEGVEVLESHFIDLECGKIRIPSSVKKIGPNAVWWSEDAEECGYIVAKDNAYYKSDKKGWLYTKEGKKVWSSSKCF